MKRTYVLILSAALGFSVACANQSEDGHCDQNNNNDDCASGLTCQKIEGQESALCCPPPSTPAKVSACIPGQVTHTDSGPKDAPSSPPNDDSGGDERDAEQVEPPVGDADDKVDGDAEPDAEV